MDAVWSGATSGGHVNLEEEFTDSLAVAPLIEDARSIISRRHKQNPKFQVSQAMLVKGGAKK